MQIPNWKLCPEDNFIDDFYWKISSVKEIYKGTNVWHVNTLSTAEFMTSLFNIPRDNLKTCQQQKTRMKIITLTTTELNSESDISENSLIMAMYDKIRSDSDMSRYCHVRHLKEISKWVTLTNIKIIWIIISLIIFCEQ